MLGLDVILEFGFWSRQERAFFRSAAEALGVEVELRYLDVGLEELWARLSERNTNLPPGTFAVSREEVELWWSWFERPAAEEIDDGENILIARVR
jgi:predicted kinase